MSRNYATEQERIDAETMRIENPNRIVGSGYIQFAPQVPFAQPLTKQPPTIVSFGTLEQTRGSAPQTQQSGRPHQAGARQQTHRGGYSSGPPQHRSGSYNPPQQGRPQRGPPPPVAAQYPNQRAPRLQQTQPPSSQQRVNSTPHHRAPPQGQPAFYGQQSAAQERPRQANQPPQQRAQGTRNQRAGGRGSATQPPAEANGSVNGRFAPASKPSGSFRPQEEQRLGQDHSSVNGMTESLGTVSLKDKPGSEGERVSKSQAKRLRKKVREGNAAKG